MGKLTAQAIDFALNLRWEDLPQDIQHQARRCLLDTIGALLAGTRTPVARIAAKIAREQLAGDQATILASGERSSGAGAALANGFAGNALDIDDGYRLVKGHPGACVLPPLLAAAELRGGCSGKELLTALVVGYELGIRAGLIRHATYTLYHASGSWGAVAGAAAAGRLLGLKAEAMRNAMGAAEYHAPIAPMMKAIDAPCMGKDGIGWGCMVALLSVLMARDGFSGVRPLFEDAPIPEQVRNLGQTWEIRNLYFKPYAACRWGQPAVAGALKVVAKHSLQAARIAGIRVRTFAAAARLPQAAPRNTEEAQYSLAFPVAAALLDGEVGPDQVLPPRLYAPELRALMERVTVEVAPEFEAQFPGKTAAEVLVETVSGRKFSSGPVEARWEPPHNLPADRDLEAKFHWLTEPLLGKMASKTLARQIWAADGWPTLAPVFNGCRLKSQSAEDASGISLPALQTGLDS